MDYNVELDGIVKQQNMNTALLVYPRGNVSKKGHPACIAETSPYSWIILNVDKAGYTRDYAILLQHTLRMDYRNYAVFARLLTTTRADVWLTLQRYDYRLVEAFMATC
jgi:clathrin heavy chain